LRRKKAVLIFLYVLLYSNFALADTINIPGDQPTIQAGIDVSVDGDTVLVQPGTYLENINFNGRSITVASLLLTTQDSSYIEQTIIDGDQNGSVVTFNNGEDSTSVLMGLMITNGLGNEDGGGIFCESSSPSLIDLIITGNSTPEIDEGYGGGIYCCNNSCPTLRNVTITDNSAYHSGGGIFCESSNLSFENVILADNSAWYGGGIYCSDADLDFISVTISGNTAGFNGGGVCSDSSNLAFENVIISGNSAGYNSGGGIFCEFSTTSFVNVTFTENSTDVSGGGICLISSSAELVDVTFSDNLVDEKGAGLYCDDSILNLINVIFTGNLTTYEYQGYGGGIYCCNYSELVMEDVTFTENYANYDGGGIYCEDAAVLSITNGTINNNSSNIGGGFYCKYSSPVLENVQISNNSADYEGGGVYCRYDSLSLVNVSIENNSAGNYGGGIYMGYCSPGLVDLTISDNIAGDNGGGIYCDHSSPNLENVKITGNSAEFAGGGIYYENSDETLLNKVTIAYNFADFYGGGIYCTESSLDLSNVTLINNEAASDGGGIYCYRSHPNVVNSIIWNNLPQEIVFTAYATFNAITIAYSDIEGGEEEIETNDNGTVYWLEGNIDSDPLFLDQPNGDFHLTEDSPCIDAGDPAFPLDPDGTIADMGAFHFYQVYLLEADFSGTPLSGVFPLSVQFSDISSGDILEWEWDFNNDGSTDSYLQNPVYVFNDPGFHTISLTVSDSTGNDTEIKADYVTVHDSLIADFTGSPTSGDLPLEVQFINLSTGNFTGSLWDFNGDGVIDSEENNPVHLYEQPGVFDVSLTITDGIDEDTETKLEYITVIDSTGISEPSLVNTELFSNYPNPFNPTTTIDFSVQAESYINISIHNTKGQKIKTVADNKFYSGFYSVNWNGDYDSNKPVSSGIYYYKLTVNGKTEAVKKCILMK